MQQSINEQELYSFKEAARQIRSPRGGCINIATLWRWHRQGRFAAECRTSGTRNFWFIKGSELLKLLEMERVQAPAPVATVQSAAARERSRQRALDYFEAERRAQ